MKDVVSDEVVPTKLNSYFSDFWFIFCELTSIKGWLTVCNSFPHWSFNHGAGHVALHRIVASGVVETTMLRQSETDLRCVLQEEATAWPGAEQMTKTSSLVGTAAASGTWERSVSVVGPSEGGNNSSKQCNVAHGGDVLRGEAEARGGWRGMRSTVAQDSGDSMRRWPVAEMEPAAARAGFRQMMWLAESSKDGWHGKAWRWRAVRDAWPTASGEEIVARWHCSVEENWAGRLMQWLPAWEGQGGN
jgi:hypothetical protein